MVSEPQLRIPGPTPVPQRVVRAASAPMINHRGPEFGAIFDAVITDLQWAMRTDNDVLVFPGSGTGGLEAAVVNLLSPREPALFCTMGAFGERWAAIAKAFGVDVIQLQVPAGEAIDPEDVERLLAQNPNVNTVFLTHNETSTGVTNDISALASVIKGRGKLLAVDSVSGAGCIPLETDGLGLDVVVTGSQKGWMSPPGIAMVAVSREALAAAEKAQLPRMYWDFARQKSYQEKHQTFTTPALSVLYALHEGLIMMREEGLEQIWSRHARIAAMIRAGLAAIGLRFLAVESHRSDTVTAVFSPADSAEGLKQLLTRLREHYGLVLAGGQGELQGKIFRVGHLGHIGDGDVYAILGTLEQAMCEVGMLSRCGLAVPAAQTQLRDSSPLATAVP